MTKHFQLNIGEPAEPQLKKSFAILSAAASSAESFNDAFETVRAARAAPNTPTDEEQDLLRAMLIFCGAGLDSMIKQLVRDALPSVIERDLGAHSQLLQFIERRLKQKQTTPDGGEGIDFKFLASTLAHPSPRDAFISELTKQITSNSLQSTDQILKTAAHFGITTQEVCTKINQLKQSFHIRNQVAHEMDVAFDTPNRMRRARSRDDMISASQLLLEVASNFLQSTQKKLNQQPITQASPSP